MAKSYKDEQKEWRARAERTVVLWSGGTLDMSIRKFKRSMPDKSLVRIYKENAWKSIQVKES
jgi:hypothetical protein